MAGPGQAGRGSVWRGRAWGKTFHYIIEKDIFVMAESKIVTVELAFRGTCALLMHNERLANPFDPITKDIAKITSKRNKKTEEDNIEIQRLEWEGGLYFSEGIGPYIPAANIKKCIMESAAINKGSTAVKRALTPLEVEVPLLYTGPRTVQGLWDAEIFTDVRSVKLNGRSKVLRTRPRFNEWALTTSMLLNVRIVSIDDFQQYVEQAGSTTGLGDYRPTFGRFTPQLLVKE